MALYANTTRHTNHENELDIQELFVFMSVDAQGRKGICGHSIPNLGSSPLITAQPREVEIMKGFARQISQETGKNIQLYRFKRVPDVLWQIGVPPTVGEKK
jgi:hypothetical protein